MALKMLLANALSGSCKCGRAAARISTRYTPACTAASTSAPTAAFASALRQASQRGIVTSAARSALGDVLQKELEYEKSNYEVPTVRHESLPGTRTDLFQIQGFFTRNQLLCRKPALRRLDGSL